MAVTTRKKSQAAHLGAVADEGQPRKLNPLNVPRWKRSWSKSLALLMR